MQLSGPLVGNANENSMVTGSNRYFMLLVCPMSAGTRPCKAPDLLRLDDADRLPPALFLRFLQLDFGTRMQTANIGACI